MSTQHFLFLKFTLYMKKKINFIELLMGKFYFHSSLQIQYRPKILIDML